MLPVSPRWAWSVISDASYEAARREPVVRVELVLDAAHQVEPRHRPPHVDGPLHLGRRVHDDGAAAGAGRTPRAAGRAPRVRRPGGPARRTRRRRRPSRARVGADARGPVADARRAARTSTQVSLSPVSPGRHGYGAQPAGGVVGDAASRAEQRARPCRRGPRRRRPCRRSSTVSVPGPSAGQSSSSAPGTAWPCTTAWARSWARSGSSTGTVTQRCTSGSGCSRNSASVTTASVPNEPIISLPRS